MKEPCMVPVYHVFLAYVQNNNFIFLHSKFDSISASNKNTVIYIAHLRLEIGQGHFCQ